MWFKQITCDTCFSVMPQIDRNNKYYYADILCNNIVHDKTDRRVTINNNCLELTIKGNNRALHINTSTFLPERWMSFCCFNCALKYSRIHNKAMLYFSNENQCVSLVLPNLEDFNNSPIPIPDWSEFDWFCQFYDIIDLSSFGTSSVFPEFMLDNIRLTSPSVSSTVSLINMTSTEKFRTMYYGSYDRLFAERQKNEMLSNVTSLIEEYKCNFGRRAQIDWHLVDLNNTFVGFVHLTKLYPAMPNEWVLEFGLQPEYEHRGIMTRAVKLVLEWAKLQGCEDVYAISEYFNKKSHSIFDRLNVPVETSKEVMWDKHAGERLMYNYHIKLQ